MKPYIPDLLEKIEEDVAKIPDHALRHHLILAMASEQGWRQCHDWAMQGRHTPGRAMLFAAFAAGIAASAVANALIAMAVR